MRHGSLFSGIGGFDLAAEWMGWENIFHCEWNPFSQKVLKHHFPKSISYDDIKKTDFSIHQRAIDIISGGFPCQPYSSSGKRLGKEDDRHLWPEMLRAIQQIQPGYVVGENVRGLTNWSEGLVFDEVQADLEAEGYEVLPFLLPACAVNAPHRRDRIWFIAHSNSRGIQSKQNLRQKISSKKWINSDGTQSNASNSKSIGRKNALENGQLERFRFRKPNQRNAWDSFPLESPICRGNDGLPKELDGITFSKWRQESIKAYGNAIVPQVAYKIFQAIQMQKEMPG